MINAKEEEEKKKKGRPRRGQGQYELNPNKKVVTGNEWAMYSNDSNLGAGVLTGILGSSDPGEGGERMALCNTVRLCHKIKAG